MFSIQASKSPDEIISYFTEHAISKKRLISQGKKASPLIVKTILIALTRLPFLQNPVNRFFKRKSVRILLSHNAEVLGLSQKKVRFLIKSGLILRRVYSKPTEETCKGNEIIQLLKELKNQKETHWIHALPEFCNNPNLIGELERISFSEKKISEEIKHRLSSSQFSILAKLRPLQERSRFREALQKNPRNKLDEEYLDHVKFILNLYEWSAECPDPEKTISEIGSMEQIFALRKNFQEKNLNGLFDQIVQQKIQEEKHPEIYRELSNVLRDIRQKADNLDSWRKFLLNIRTKYGNPAAASLANELDFDGRIGCGELRYTDHELYRTLTLRLENYRKWKERILQEFHLNSYELAKIQHNYEKEKDSESWMSSETQAAFAIYLHSYLSDQRDRAFLEQIRKFGADLAEILVEQFEEFQKIRLFPVNLREEKQTELAQHFIIELAHPYLSCTSDKKKELFTLAMKLQKENIYPPLVLAKGFRTFLDACSASPEQAIAEAIKAANLFGSSDQKKNLQKHLIQTHLIHTAEKHSKEVGVNFDLIGMQAVNHQLKECAVGTSLPKYEWVREHQSLIFESINREAKRLQEETPSFHEIAFPLAVKLLPPLIVGIVPPEFREQTRREFHEIDLAISTPEVNGDMERVKAFLSKTEYIHVMRALPIAFSSANLKEECLIDYLKEILQTLIREIQSLSSEDCTREKLLVIANDLKLENAVYAENSVLTLAKKFLMEFISIWYQNLEAIREENKQLREIALTPKEIESELSPLRKFLLIDLAEIAANRKSLLRTMKFAKTLGNGSILRWMKKYLISLALKQMTKGTQQEIQVRKNIKEITGIIEKVAPQLLENHRIEMYLDYLMVVHSRVQSDEPINTKEFIQKTLEFLSSVADELVPYQNAIFASYENAIKIFS